MNPDSGLPPPRPLAQLTAIAAADPDPTATYKPTKAAQALVGALIQNNGAHTTLKDLAAKAGIDESTVHRLAGDAHAVNWVLNQSAAVANIGLAAVYARLLNRALYSKSPAWAKLFMERFDVEYRRGQSDTTGARNTQINVYSGMSDTELQALVQSKMRQAFGGPVPTA